MRTNLIKPKNISEAKSKTSNDGMLDMVIAFDNHWVYGRLHKVSKGICH